MRITGDQGEGRPFRAVDIQERTSVAKNMAQRRRDMGFAAARVAREIGTNMLNVRNWEKVVPRTLTAEAWRSWCRILSVSEDYRGYGALERITRTSATAIATEAPTFHELIIAVAEGVATARRKDDSAALERDKDMLMRRYGLFGEDQTTLQAIGVRHGLTRERVRQLLNRLAQTAVRVSKPIALLDAARQRIAGLAPTPLAMLDPRMRDLLGPSLSTKDAARFAVEMLAISIYPHGVAVQDAIDHIEIVGTALDAKILRDVRTEAFRMIRSCGAANAKYVCGAVNALGEAPVTYQQVLRTLQCIPGYSEFPADEHWFWFGHDGVPRNGLLRVAHHVLREARRRVDIEEIAGAMLRSRRPATQPGDPERLNVLPPLRVLESVLAATPWIERRQHDDFALQPPVPELDHDDDSLQRNLLVEFLRTQGGVAKWADIKKELVETGRLNPITCGVYLSSIPAIKPLANGVYAIRGAALDATGLTRAFRLGAETRNDADADVDRGEPLQTLDIVLLTHHCESGSLHLGRRFDPLRSGQWRIVGLNTHISITERNASGARYLTGLRPQLNLAGAQPGNRLRVAFHRDGTAEITVSTAHTNEAPPG